MQIGDFKFLNLQISTCVSFIKKFQIFRTDDARFLPTLLVDQDILIHSYEVARSRIYSSNPISIKIRLQRADL